MKYLRVFLLISLFAIIFGFIPNSSLAATVPVNATVPSKISTETSSIDINATQVLADGNQKVTVTIKVYDSDNNPLVDVPVLLKSNRGDLDWIENVSSSTVGVSYLNRPLADASGENPDTGQGIISQGSGLDGVTGYSDINGMVYFEVLSTVPGEVDLTAIGDTMVTIGSVKTEFLPLPFPSNVTINLQIPKVLAPLIGGNKSGVVTIIKPKVQTFNSNKSVNLGVQINIPFWIVLLIFLSFVLNIVFLFIIFVLSVWTKSVQRKEVKNIEKDTTLLEKEESELEAIINKNKD